VDVVAQRKRPDAWTVHWAKRCLLILEFTRPNDRDVFALQNTDTLKTVWYTPLRNRLATLLPGLTAVLTEALIRDLTSQTLTELTAGTNIYSVRYAALQKRQHAQYG
jgi:hypothetical protein